LSEVWAVLLDGLVGAVVGGGVTAWAVLYTLRRDRASSEDQALDTAVSRLAAELSMLIYFVTARQMGQPAGQQTFARSLAVGTEVVSRAKKSNEKFADVVEEFLMTIIRNASSAEAAGWRQSDPSVPYIQITLSALLGACGRWMQSPEDFVTGEATAEKLRALSSEHEK
jgi:hypothetical protein